MNFRGTGTGSRRTGTRAARAVGFPRVGCDSDSTAAAVWQVARSFRYNRRMTLPSLAFDAAVLAVLPYPRIDPVAFSLGPFVLRWYALSYLAGVLGAWWLLRRVAYAAATGGFHGAVARFVEARDRASPGLGGASWTHCLLYTS
ncbi:MAG: prolipoprotein diacylglyceryl transferase, partial [Alphaproteobacteria bacterium]|nr:prolipoprotein diacylglyceryl transferase [Alphaproteobacteria bacterium]